MAIVVDTVRNFRSKCIETYEIDPAHFLSVPVLALRVSLKTGIELGLLTNIDMLQY